MKESNQKSVLDELGSKEVRLRILLGSVSGRDSLTRLEPTRILRRIVELIGTAEMSEWNFGVTRLEM